MTTSPAAASLLSAVTRTVGMRVLAVPFFPSGVAALAYQVCWQRLLFVALGTDIDSITI